MTFEQKKRHKLVINVTFWLKMWHFPLFFDIPRGNGYEFFWLKRRICPSKNIAILPKKCNKKNLTKNQGFLKMPKNVTFWTENSNLHLYYNFKRWHLNKKNVTNMSQMWHFGSKCDISLFFSISPAETATSFFDWKGVYVPQKHSDFSKKILQKKILLRIKVF